MNTYENLIVLDASLPDENIQSAIEKITELITTGGGEVLKAEQWGRRKLAYEIKKHSKGFYVLFLFNAPSDVIKKLEDYYKVLDAVVKFLVIRLEKKQRAAALASVAPKTEPAQAAPAQ